MVAADNFLTVPELAREWTVCRATVHRWISRGINGIRLDALRVGHGWRIRPADATAFFAKLTARTTGENGRDDSPEIVLPSEAERRKRIERAMNGLREKGV